MGEKFQKQCQSCGMPLEKGAKSGTEADGSKSLKYCQLCYLEGSLINPDMTLEEMKETVDKALKEKGWVWPMRVLAKWQIPTLERWSNK